MFYTNERLLCKFVFVRAAKWRLSTSYADSVIQTFDYERLSSVEHTSAQETGWLEKKTQDFLFPAKAVHSKRCSDCWEYLFHPRHAFTVCFT